MTNEQIKPNPAFAIPIVDAASFAVAVQTCIRYHQSSKKPLVVTAKAQAAIKEARKAFEAEMNRDRAAVEADNLVQQAELEMVSDWLRRRNAGPMSRTILAATLSSSGKADTSNSHPLNWRFPYNTDDFDDCQNIVEALSERQREVAFSTLQKKSPVWKRIIEVWEILVELMAKKSDDGFDEVDRLLCKCIEPPNFPK